MRATLWITTDRIVYESRRLRTHYIVNLVVPLCKHNGQGSTTKTRVRAKPAESSQETCGIRAAFLLMEQL